jgi:hypothetical protein
MGIKFKLDTEKAAKATVAIVASYGLGQVSKGTKYPQLAFADTIALIAIIAILYGPRLVLRAKLTKMMPDMITCLFKEAHDSSPPLKGKLSNNDLLAILETLLPLLMVIPYNQLNGVHSLTAIFTEVLSTNPNMAPNLYSRLVSHSTTRLLLTMQQQPFAFMRRPPTNPASMTTPVTRWLSEACPSFSVMLLMKFGTMT